MSGEFGICDEHVIFLAIMLRISSLQRMMTFVNGYLSQKLDKDAEFPKDVDLDKGYGMTLSKIFFSNKQQMPSNVNLVLHPIEKKASPLSALYVDRL